MTPLVNDCYRMGHILENLFRNIAYDICFQHRVYGAKSLEKIEKKIFFILNLIHLPQDF